MLRTTLAIALACCTSAAMAQMNPAGLWKTIDDKDGSAKSEIRIVEKGGVLSGRVEKILDKTKQEEKCVECKDERKDQPIIGMTIIKNAKAGADKEVFEGGEILDPNNGKTYKLRLKMLDGGKKLEVRGYIGPFFRNQQWIRVE